jgi:KipI family sensor histidine kinase inhibitor
VIARHSEREYAVLAIGFAPGFAYLGELDPALVLPRRDSPRARVPAGAVAIAGAQTGIYPRVSPGGWHLLGTTDAVLFDAARESPALFRAGDRVRFVPVA